MKKEEIKSIYENGKSSCIDNLQKSVLALRMYGFSLDEILKEVDFVFDSLIEP